MRRSCVDITIVLDSDAEDSETFVVNLEENVDGVAVSSTGGTTTVTIVDCESVTSCTDYRSLLDYVHVVDRTV